MTISTTESRKSYTGNGSTASFSFPYKFLADGDLKVYVDNVLKTLTTDYTLSGAGDASGGTVTFVTAPASLTSVVFYRDMAITQEVDYITGDAFPAETHEEALDRLTMIDQQQEDQIDRAVKLQLGDETSSMELPLKATRATKMLGFDADGDPIMSASTVDEIDASVSAALGSGVLATAYQFTGDGTTVDFTLTGGVTDILNSQSVIVDIDGVTQHTDTYTVSGKVVTFSTAPPLNADIQIRYNAYLGTATDAASATYNQGGTGASSRTIENKLQEFVSVKDFGAVGDSDGVGGGTDDTAAIQAAIDSGIESIFFPEGNYLVTSTISLAQSTALFGNNPARNAGSHIHFMVAADDILFRSNFANTSLTNIYVTDISDDVYSAGVRTRYNTMAYFTNDITYVDVDTRIDSCTFVGFRTTLHIIGRGLFAYNTIFALTATAVKFDRDSRWTASTSVGQTLLTAHRAYNIDNCRFHGMGTGTYILENNGTYKTELSGIKFTNNYIDTNAGILIGSCKASLFADNNHIYGCEGALFDIQGQCIDTVITGNNFSGYEDAIYQTTMSPTQWYGNFMAVSGTTSNLTVVGNNISRVRGTVFSFGSTTTNVIITNNTFDHALGDTIASNAYIVYLSGTSTRGRFSNNIIHVTTTFAFLPTSYAVSGGGTITDWQVFDNIINQPTLAESSLTNYLDIAVQETGTWTPAHGNFVATYTVQTGTYTRINDVVHANIVITTSAITLPDGSGFSISLPTIAGKTPVAGSCLGSFSWETGDTRTLKAVLPQINGFTVVGTGVAISNSSGNLTYDNLVDQAGTMRVAVTYKIA
jgi:hypothetical protein